MGRTSGLPSKIELVERVVSRLREELEVVLEAAAQAKAGATHEEARPENQYDTRGLEQSYLAGAQAARAEQIASEIAAAKATSTEPREGRIRLGALVELDDGTEAVLHFLCGAGGGTDLQIEKRRVRVITSESPLGQLLIGKEEGDVVELRIRGQIRELEITGVS